MIKKISAFIFMFVLVLFTFWIFGFNFDTRGFDTGFAFMCSLILGFWAVGFVSIFSK